MTRDWEFYETPRGVTAALLASGLVQLGAEDTILDPCAGDLAILLALEELRLGLDLDVVANDLDAHRLADSGYDATDAADWADMDQDFGPFDWVITNPPFSLAHKIIPLALSWATKGVAMLLPLRFKEPASARRGVLRQFPWTAEIVLGGPRPSFTENGRTDSVTTFWAVWIRGAEPMRLFYATDPTGESWGQLFGQDRYTEVFGELQNI